MTSLITPFMRYAAHSASTERYGRSFSRERDGLYNDPTNRQLSVLPFPGKFGSSSSTTEGWTVWLVSFGSNFLVIAELLD